MNKFSVSNAMSLSICIPTYNRPEIFNLLRSISFLCSENISIIVSDNNSSIYSASEFIHQVRAINPAIIAVRQDSNLGYSGNILALVSLAKSEWLTFLMSDDTLILSNFIELVQNIQPSDQLIFSNGRSQYCANNWKAKFKNSLLFLNSNFNIFLFKMLNRRDSHNPAVYISNVQMQRLWGLYLFLPYPALPNSIFVRTKILKRVVNSQLFLDIYGQIRSSGHCLDFLLLILAAKEASLVKLNFNPTYELLKHDNNAQNKIKENTPYHLEIDRYVIRRVIDSSSILSRLSIIPRFRLLVSWCLSNNTMRPLLAIQFIKRELVYAIKNINPKPKVKFY